MVRWRDIQQSHAIQQSNDYVQLRQLIKNQGLYARQPLYYSIQVILNGVMFAATVAGLFVLPGLPLKLLDALFMGFTMTHIGYIIHDAGHRQIFPSLKANDALLLVCGFLAGMSPSWWVKTHNKHHSTPNDTRYDPHMAIPTLAFSEDQASAKRGGARLVTRFQAFYFFPLLAMEGFGLRLASVQFLLRGEARYTMIEAAGMVAHFALYGWLLATTMSIAEAAAFVLVHQTFAGLYMGSVFAPNHKGMPLIRREEDIDFLRRQVLTTRNVSPNPITDYWCGGLNYQIEHHLFPTLSRNKLKAARLIVRRFCEEHSVPYAEKGLFASYAEVLRYLNEMAKPLRAAPAVATPDGSRDGRVI